MDAQDKMTYDLEVECWTDDHLWFALRVGLPGVLLWSRLVLLQAWECRDSFWEC